MLTPPRHLQPGCELHSHCGYTQFWYVSSSLRKVWYYALLLHGYAWWDAVRAAPSASATLVRRICREHGGEKWRVRRREAAVEKAAWQAEQLS